MQHRGGMAPPGQQPREGGLQHRPQDAVGDHPAIHQEDLETGAGQGKVRVGEQSAHLPGAGPQRHRQHPGRHLTAVEGRHPGRQFLGSRGVQEDPGRGLQGKMDLGVAQGQVAHGLHDVGLLRLLAFEELAPGRGVEEEFGDLHLGAAGRGPGGGFLQGAGHRGQFKAGGRPGWTGDQGQAAHRTDAGQGLAPEPQGGDVQQVRFIPELAGGVALQAQARPLPGSCPSRRPPPGCGPGPLPRSPR